MKVIWKGDPGNAAHVLHWHGVHFVPGKETDVPDDFPSMGKLAGNPYFTVVAPKADPSPHPASAAAKVGKV